MAGLFSERFFFFAILFFCGLALSVMGLCMKGEADDFGGGSRVYVLTSAPSTLQARLP